MKNNLLCAQPLSNSTFGYNNNNILNTPPLKILLALSFESTNSIMETLNRTRMMDKVDNRDKFNIENDSQQKRVSNNPTRDRQQFKSDDDERYDGMIHSLPCNKYNPYKCPKCMEVFNTLQLFVANVL